MQELFNFVKSLKKSEKRVFKQLTQAFGQEQNYVILFDCLEQLETFDEEQILKKYHQKCPKVNLSKEKAILEEMLFKTLRWLNIIEDPTPNYLENALIASYKKQVNLAQKQATKALNLAQKKQNQQNEYIALQRLHYLSCVHYGASHYEEKFSLMQKSQKVLKELEISKLLHDIQLKIAYIYNENKPYEQLYALLSALKTISLEDTNDYNTITYYHICYAQIYQVLGKYSDAAIHYQSVIEHLSKKLDLNNVGVYKNIAIAYENKITCKLEMGDLNVLKELEELKTLISEDEFIKEHLHHTYSSAYALYLIHKKEYTSCITYLKNHQMQFKAIYTVTQDYHLSVAYLLNHQFKEAYRIASKQALNTTTFQIQFYTIELLALLAQKSYDLLVSRSSSLLKQHQVQNYSPTLIQFFKMCRKIGQKAELEPFKIEQFYKQLKGIIYKKEEDRLLILVLENQYNYK